VSPGGRTDPGKDRRVDPDEDRRTDSWLRRAHGRVCAGGQTTVPTCSEDDCEEPATVELHIPWAENRLVCAGHARVVARQDGVVADPLDDSDDVWP